MSNDRFDILEQSRLTKFISDGSNKTKIYPKWTFGNSSITLEGVIVTSLTDEDLIESPRTSLHLWGIKTIEAIGPDARNMSISWDNNS